MEDGRIDGVGAYAATSIMFWSCGLVSGRAVTSMHSSLDNRGCGHSSADGEACAVHVAGERGKTSTLTSLGLERASSFSAAYAAMLASISSCTVSASGFVPSHPSSTASLYSPRATW
eukprot:scaffold4146_cov63-Phaeocystis_antarctica.AAC.4